MNQSEYIAEKQRRQFKGLSHWEAMLFKYDDAGFSTWGWGNTPLPHYYLYEGYFLFLIADTPARELLPQLEYVFYGDAVDLDYLEGLLLGYEEAGVLASVNPIAVNDVTGDVILLDDQGNAPFKVMMPVDDQEEAGTEAIAIGAQVAVKAGQNLAARFEIIRNWIGRKRASTKYVELHITEEEAEASDTNLATTTEDSNQLSNSKEAKWDRLLLKKGSYSLADLDELLVKMKLIKSLEPREYDRPLLGQVLIGVREALRTKHILLSHDNAKFAEIIEEHYGKRVANFNTVTRGYRELRPEAAAAYSDALLLLSKA
jgi:hypothetical protein